VEAEGCAVSLEDDPEAPVGVEQRHLAPP
jgi:hypothetical protein